MTDHRYPDEVVEKALQAYWEAAVPGALDVFKNTVTGKRKQALMAGLRAALDTWNRYGAISPAAEGFYTATREEHSPRWSELPAEDKNSVRTGIEAAREAVLWYNDPEAPEGEKTSHHYSSEAVDKALEACLASSERIGGELREIMPARRQRLRAGIRAALEIWDLTDSLLPATQRFWEVSRGAQQTSWDDLGVHQKDDLLKGIQLAREAAMDAQGKAEDVARSAREAAMGAQGKAEHPFLDIEWVVDEESQHAPGPDGLTPEDFHATPMPAPPTHTVDVHYSGPHGEELTFTVQLPASHDPMTLPNAVAATLNMMLHTTVVSAQRVEVVEP